MSSFYKDKVVIVTGGTEGIGKALVDELITQGARVATCARNHDKLYRLQTQHADAYLHTLVADVSNEHDCQRLVDTTVRNFGGIDILINNAGISMRAELKDTTPDVIRKVMDINFFGPVYCTKHALPHIIERRGTVAAISSIAGYRGLPGRSGYSASKHALQGWMEAIRTELLDTGVNVMWACPGFTTSNIRNAALNKEGKPQGESPMDESDMMTAEECARIILHAIQRRKRTVVMTFTGKRTVFMNRFFPKLTDKMVRKFFYKNGELVK
jgi:short-subunit dehydrogenase